MKTKEELNALKSEVDALNAKLAELNEDGLNQVIGGNEEFTILPRNQVEFWRSWNPGFPTNVAHSDVSGFIDSDDYIEKETYK